MKLLTIALVAFGVYYIINKAQANAAAQQEAAKKKTKQVPRDRPGQHGRDTVEAEKQEIFGGGGGDLKDFFPKL